MQKVINSNFAFAVNFNDSPWTSEYILPQRKKS